MKQLTLKELRQGAVQRKKLENGTILFLSYNGAKFFIETLIINEQMKLESFSTLTAARAAFKGKIK